MTPERHKELINDVRIWPEHFANVAREMLGTIAAQMDAIKKLKQKFITCDGFFSAAGMGAPEPSQKQQILKYLATGCEVTMVTRHAQDLGRLLAVKAWCQTHFGRELPIVSQEDFEAGQ